MAVPLDAWQHYSTIFRCTEELGMPHGGGWADETSWLISFLMEMKYTKKAVKTYYENKSLQ